MQSILAEGAKTFIPPEARNFRNVTFQSRINSEVVENLTAVGIIERAPVKSTYRLFAIPKADGRVRVLYDLSQLTPFLGKPTCHLPRPMDVLANENAQWAIKVDLSDGFFHIPVHSKLSQYLGIQYQGVTYRWTRLPMGLATAPAIMQAVMREAAKYISAQCPLIQAYVYLDDFLFVARHPEHLTGIPQLMRDMGLTINVKKSQLQPVTELTYLGIHLDLANRTLSVPADLKTKVLRAIADAPQRSLLYAQRLAGFVNFIRPVAKLPLQIIHEILARADNLPDLVAAVPDTDWTFSYRDYWHRFVHHPRWIATDATPGQLGFADAEVQWAVKLPRLLPIFQAELLAIYLAMYLVPPATTIHTDNTATLSAAHKGRCPPAWLPWIMQLFSHRASSIRYVPTYLNPADEPSRWE